MTEYVLTQEDIDEGFMPITDAAKTGEWVYTRVVWWDATKEIRTAVTRFEEGEFKWSFHHGGAVAWKPFPADLDPEVVDRQIRIEHEAARQAGYKAAEKASNDLRFAIKPRDIPVLAALAAGCRLHYQYRRGYKWHAPRTTCALIHPDGREKDVSGSSKYRLRYWKLIEPCNSLDDGFGENHDYALTEKGVALAATCTKSLEAIFKQPKAAKPAIEAHFKAAVAAVEKAV